MNIFLDTHIALWAITKPEKLSDKALGLLLDNYLYVSTVSVKIVSYIRNQETMFKGKNDMSQALKELMKARMTERFEEGYAKRLTDSRANFL